MKKQSLIPALASLAIIAFAGAAQAQIIISVPSYSFEEGTTTAFAPYVVTESNTTSITNWTGSFTGGTNRGFGYVSTASASVLTTPGTSDGSQAAIEQVYSGGTTSTLSTASSLGIIAANTTYTLTVAIGAPATFTSDSYVGSLWKPGETAATATISLTGNGTAFASSTVANNLVIQGSLTDYTVTFTTGATGGLIGESLGINLTSLKANYGTGYTYADPGFEADIFDNVRLTDMSTVVPEPSAWALLVGGMGFLFFLVQRKSLKV